MAKKISEHSFEEFEKGHGKKSQSEVKALPCAAIPSAPI